MFAGGGYRVRCLVREAARFPGRGWKGVEVAIGDVLDYQTLVPALQGVDTAYYLVHAMAGGEEGFEARDLYAAQNFGRAAQEAGVRRIIHLGGLGRDEDELSPHLRSRHEVGEQLRSWQVAITEFRAGVIIGAGSVSFDLVRYLTERVPILISPRWVRLVTPLPVSVARPLIDGVKNQLIVEDPTAQQMFGFRPMGYEKGVRTAYCPQAGPSQQQKIHAVICSEARPPRM